MRSEEVKSEKWFWWQRILLLLLTFHFSLFTYPQVGTWENHLAYNELQNICAMRTKESPGHIAGALPEWCTSFLHF